jgi:hypothetical protein
MGTWSARLRFCPGEVLSAVRLRSILGVWYICAVSWLYRVRFAEGVDGLGPGLGSTSPSFVTSRNHPSGVSSKVGRGPVSCGTGVW